MESLVEQLSDKQTNMRININIYQELRTFFHGVNFYQECYSYQKGGCLYTGLSYIMSMVLDMVKVFTHQNKDQISSLK